MTSPGTGSGAGAGPESGVEAGTDVVTLGETMGLVAATGSGPFTVGAPARFSFGGAETNVAIGLSRLGHRAAWIGRLGADPIGSMVRKALLGESVDVSHVRRDPDVATGLMLREQRTVDRVRVTYYRRALAGSRLAPEDLDPDLVRGARVLHLSGITPALSESARAATHRAVDLAREAGVRVSLDLNYRAALWSREDAGSEFARLVKLADIVFAGEEEAALVATADTPSKIAAEIAAHGPAEVVIKLGADGALARAGSEELHGDALAVTCVDPVGAGDAFVAGYLSGVLDRIPLRDRLRRGNTCGAFAVSVAGDWEGLPRRHELTTLDGVENVAR